MKIQSTNYSTTSFNSKCFIPNKNIFISRLKYDFGSDIANNAEKQIDMVEKMVNNDNHDYGILFKFNYGMNSPYRLDSYIATTNGKAYRQLETSGYEEFKKSLFNLEFGLMDSMIAHYNQLTPLIKSKLQKSINFFNEALAQNNLHPKVKERYEKKLMSLQEELQNYNNSNQILVNPFK